MKKILLICHNEICYNPRLLKAADFFYANGWEVTVFNPLIGIGSKETYESIKESRPWRVIENDISRHTTLSKIKWLVVSVFHKFAVFTVDRLNWTFLQDYYLNKGLLLTPNLGTSYDVVLVHLIDNLPFAMRFKRKDNSKVIYDSQEYFVGQYAAFEKNKLKWVVENEKRNISNVDILLTTTNAMLQQLRDDYSLKIPAFRVRNVPTYSGGKKEELIFNDICHENTPKVRLKLVWHGMGVYFNNRRGLHILLEAISLCRENVHLYLQGNINEFQKLVYSEYEQKLNLKGKVTFVPAAHPDHIVDSLRMYDVGLTSELPEEKNQELTSSNKLFDYIHAGLAVISSDVLGLTETIDEFNNGLTYQPGNSEELRDKIDFLAKSPGILRQLKQHSIESIKQLYWEKDYIEVMEQID